MMSAVSAPPAGDTRGPQHTRKSTFHELPGPTPRRFFMYRPSTEISGAPLVVSVHGIARNAAAHVFRLQEEAERLGLVVVAPLFEKEVYGQYQQLMDPGTDVRADAALLDIVEAAARLSKTDPERLLLFGFSGGAQFTHRFVLAHPRRVVSAVHAAAGWYTFPDPARTYPYGLKDAKPLRLRASEAARVPQHVIVGELDIERDRSLRKSKQLNRQQGRTRVERARRWVEAMGAFSRREHGLHGLTFMTLPAVGHSFPDSVERANLAGLVFERFAADAHLAPLIEY